MITKKKIAFGCAGILAGAIIFIAACHKNTSSSSASGSLNGAISDLALVALNNAHNGGGGFPTIGPPCTGMANTGSFIYTSNSGSCPSSAYQPVATYTSSSLSSTVTNCQYGGYTFNGTLNFQIPGGSSLVECQLITTPSDISLTGSYLLGSSSFTITGNGITETCNNTVGTNGPINITASNINFETVPNNTLTGSLSGTACEGTISNLSFYWK